MSEADMKSICVVKGEHTLGILNTGRTFMQVLSGSVIKGGHDWRNGPVSTFGATIRVATLQDFKDYRVSSEGYELSKPEDLEEYLASLNEVQRNCVFRLQVLRHET